MIKKKVEVGGPLTNSELILMNILWDAQRPITGPEILAYVNASPEGPAFARTSYHAMVNNLLDKNYIISIGGCGHGKNQARKRILCAPADFVQALLTERYSGSGLLVVFLLQRNFGRKRGDSQIDRRSGPRRCTGINSFRVA